MKAIWSKVWRKKSPEAARALAEEKIFKLKRELGTWELFLLVVGSTVGVGIFVLPGVVAAEHAGPGVIISFVLSGLVALSVGLAYVELAAMVPVAGSAYTYAYVALGELLAWIIAWDLIFEFAVSTSAVAVGWSGYIVELFKSFGITLPTTLTTDTLHGGIVNLPAILAITGVVAIALLGIRQAGHSNALFTGIKLAAALFFIIIGVRFVDIANWQPIAPYGWSGIFTGAALVFFAYVGFDGITTVMEEVRDPQRTIPKAFIGGIVFIILLYVVVSAILVGMLPYPKLDVPDPVAFALLQVGVRWGSALLSTAIIFGVLAVLLADVLIVSRYLYALGRDGLLPPFFAKVHPERRVPTAATLLIFSLASILAGFLSVGELAELANIGGLTAFLLTTISVVVLRWTRPNEKRPFRVPFLPFFAIIGIVGSLLLIVSLPLITFARFSIWLVIGLIIYFTQLSHLEKHENPLI